MTHTLINVATITKGMHNTKKTTITIVVETITTIMGMNITITMDMKDTETNFYLPAMPGHPKHLQFVVYWSGACSGHE
ncbi:hypothetical protein HHE06_13800 [Helicobacter heilmannii]|nr:hypothetical protein [Helicobacter heilmannii]CRF49018.1 hypothetical protein HHE03_06140 [Helicobacter heilmannii]CRF51496.1 hypothetical protein HHE06_13800 [Helicobacter heilmannii]